MSQLSEFFNKHISIIRSRRERCRECGEQLRGSHSEVAHILPKTTYKSVQCDDDNVVYLCGAWSKNQCHTKFDNSSHEIITQMNIYPYICEKFSILRERVTERIHFNLIELYEK